jgi:hypothetical protein
MTTDNASIPPSKSQTPPKPANPNGRVSSHEVRVRMGFTFFGMFANFGLMIACMVGSSVFLDDQPAYARFIDVFANHFTATLVGAIGTAALGVLLMSVFMKRIWRNATTTPVWLARTLGVVCFGLFIQPLSLVMTVVTLEDAANNAGEWYNFQYKNPLEGTMSTYYVGHKERHGIVGSWLSLQGISEGLKDREVSGSGTFSQRLNAVAGEHDHAPLKIVDEDNRVFQIEEKFPRAACQDAVTQLPEAYVLVSVNGVIPPVPHPGETDPAGFHLKKDKTVPSASGAPNRTPNPASNRASTPNLDKTQNTALCNRLKDNKLVFQSMPNAFE